MTFIPNTKNTTIRVNSVRPIEKLDGSYELVSGENFEWNAFDKLTVVYGKDPLWVIELMIGDIGNHHMSFQEHFWNVVAYVLNEYDKEFDSD